MTCYLCPLKMKILVKYNIVLGIYFLIRGVEEMRQHSFSGVTVGEQQPLGQRKGSMAFKDLSATTIAEQLTFLEYRMLRRIPVRITHCWFIFFLGCCCFFFFQKWYLTTRVVFLSRGQKLLRPKWAKCIPVSDQNSAKTQPMGQHIPIWLDALL